MEPIDLRSDTVTRPSPAMRRAMAEAEVGDDVYGEDPSVLRLEALAAERVGKPCALFVPSGTMANQIALRAHTRAGDVVLAGENAHILRYEAGAAAALSGLQIETLGSGGLFDAAELRAGLPPDDVHCAPATLLAVENTHNAGGGRVWPADQLAEVTAAARTAGLRSHLDGARLFNASVASGRSVSELCAAFDSVAFCLSKGLGAPAGSLVCGSSEFMERAKRLRKMLGGGMRQAGILAAAGSLALQENVERLAEDHANAARLAKGLGELGFEVTPPETNIVMFRLAATQGSARSFLRGIGEQGLLINPFDATRLRAVTHLDVDSKDIDETLTRIARVLSP